MELRDLPAHLPDTRQLSRATPARPSLDCISNFTASLQASSATPNPSDSFAL